MTTISPDQGVPEEWLIEAEAIFNKIRSNPSYISKDELDLFLSEFLKSCPQEMRESRPPTDDFFQRFSSSKNDTLTLEDFKRVFVELCLVNLDFTIDEAS